MGALQKTTCDAIRVFAAEYKHVDAKSMDMLLVQLRLANKQIERSYLTIAACLYYAQEYFDAGQKYNDYDNIQDLAADLFGYKRTSTVNMINLYKTYFDVATGTLLPQYIGYGYSQLVELLPVVREAEDKADGLEAVLDIYTPDMSVRAIREQKRAASDNQTSDCNNNQTSDREQITIDEAISGDVDEDYGQYAEDDDNQTSDMMLDLIHREGLSTRQEIDEMVHKMVGCKVNVETRYSSDCIEVKYLDKTYFKAVKSSAPLAGLYTYMLESLWRIDTNLSINSLDLARRANGDVKEQKRAASDNQTSDNMQTLNNVAQRKAFLETYITWEPVLHSLELGITVSRYNLSNGAKLYHTHWQYWVPWLSKFANGSRLCLVTPSEDDYKLDSYTTGGGGCKSYELDGTAPTCVLDYMTKRRDVLLFDSYTMAQIQRVLDAQEAAI
jgi:hypothetical protein